MQRVREKLWKSGGVDAGRKRRSSDGSIGDPKAIGGDGETVMEGGGWGIFFEVL